MTNTRTAGSAVAGLRQFRFYISLHVFAQDAILRPAAFDA